MKKFLISSSAVLFIISITIICASAISSSKLYSDSKPDSTAATTNIKEPEVTKSSEEISIVDGSIEDMFKNPNFKQHGYDIKGMTETVKQSKNDVIEHFKKVRGDKELLKANKVLTVLAKFTDKETPQLPNSNIKLIDYPVWMVTLQGVNVETRFGTILADTVVIFDANTGEELESFSYPHVVQ